MSLKSFLMLCTLAAIWGGTFLLGALAIKALPPLTITLHRVFWAIPALALLLWLRRIPVARSPKIWGAYLGMGLLNNVIPFSLIFWAQSQITSGLAAILNGTTALFGAVAAGLLLRDEQLNANKLIGALFGLLGVAIIMGPNAWMSFRPDNLAQLAILAATLSYALASVWGKILLSNQPALMNALGMLCGSVVILLPIVIWHDGVPSLRLPISTWTVLLALSLGSTAIAYVLYFEILKHAGAANLMLVTLLIPPFAIFMDWLFLGETLPGAAWAGLAVIALGLILTDGRLLHWIKQKRAW